MCRIIEVQVPVQTLQAPLPIPVETLVSDLQPEKASEGILEGAEVAGVHDINCEMLKFGAWTTEDVGGLGTLMCRSFEVAVMRDEGLPVASRWGEVVKV
jgi:hypothetical protein